MAKKVTPKAFMIAATAIDHPGLEAYFAHLGVKWASDSKNDHEVLTEIAGKSCYMSFDTSLNSNLTMVNGRKNEKYIQEGIIAAKHGSVLEHCTVSFMITDVSRVVTHELVRHGVGTAFSQLSGRFVSTEELCYFLPSDIAKSPAAAKALHEAFEAQEKTAAYLRNALLPEGSPFSLKKKITSAIRRIFGNGATNQIMVTGNHRAWRNIIEQRVQPAAEEEIRVIIADIARQLQFMYPAIYADMVLSLDEEGLPSVNFGHSKV